MDYKINPVKATLARYANTDHGLLGIQGLNDTCFGVCAAFSGTYDTFAMDPACTQSCEDFIEQKRHEIFGVGRCDHQVPYRPVFWDQTPHYVPQLLKKGLTPEQARTTCKMICAKKGGMLPQECQQNCDIDADAVESYQKEINFPSVNPNVNSGFVKSTNNDDNKDKNTSAIFWVVVVIMLIIIGILVSVVVKRYL